MKIVVALDSFKGTLRALPACEIVKEALLSVDPSLEVVSLPMADGGEGTAEVLMHNMGGRWIPKTVTGPLESMQVEAGYVWFEDDTVLVEMATASGLELLTKSQLNPLKTTTYGTGELIRDAIEQGAKKIFLAVGGSATVDAGVGAAAALGWRFLDSEDQPVGYGGGALDRINSIIKPDKPVLVPVEVLCDVNNLLCGPMGAARVFAPQKGASPAQVDLLEGNLMHLAALIKCLLGKDLTTIRGGGAAGGLAAGAAAFMNATIISGIDTIIQKSHLPQACEGADWIVTGEGSFDDQSLHGKVVSGLLETADKTHTKVALLAGQISVYPQVCKYRGIQLMSACRKEDMSLEYALENAQPLLADAARELIAQMLE